MVRSATLPASRYRRRILALGAVAAGALYVIGAPIYASRIENDLEQRVPNELAEAGFTGVDVAFSGQDGTIRCDEPLSDPDDALAVAFAVNGVRQIELVQSDESPCRVRTATTGDADDDGADASTVDATTGGDDLPAGASGDDDNDADDDGNDDAAASETSAPSGGDDEAAASDDADLATIADVVAANPDLGFVSVLLGDADVGTVEGPITLFAPRNEAFDAVSADVLGQLQNDADLLNAVLSHHVVDGAHEAADLTVGELDAFDGTTVTIAVDDDGVTTVDGAAIVEADIVASNGIVHIVDGLLLPPGVEIGDADARAEARVAYDGTVVLLDGVVASEVERQIVLDAAVDAVGEDAVVDEFTVDPDTGIDADTAATIADLIGAMPSNLLSGEVGFDGEAVYATGLVADETGRGGFAVAAAAAGVIAVIDLDPDAAPANDEGDGDAATDPADDAAAAAELEAQLNAFVQADPIQFAPGSSLITPETAAVLDQLAETALTFDAVQITVEGHTDSDGIDIENLQLSQNRAEAVREELIERGLDAESVTAVGFGSEQPVLVDGVEDKDASRRVEFRVIAGS